MIINDPPVCMWMCFQLSVCADETAQEAPPCRCSCGVYDVEYIGAMYVEEYIMDHERPPVSWWL